ncbi:hypothetical protein [Verrucomicrobium spinosum]|uniref:hypothetical protein n=1 Tax=Verrucomicrobium spinosum TaxID=2736 RepID=UPI00017465A9|nr:hypothetical protein [Verrucomicrobium spinosum]
MKEKSRAIRRAEAAEGIEKKLQSIINDLEKIPSFNGKARFMDKVFRVRTHAFALASNLRLDANEE